MSKHQSFTLRRSNSLASKTHFKSPAQETLNVSAHCSDGPVRMPRCLHHARATAKAVRSITIYVVRSFCVAFSACPMRSVILLKFFKHEVGYFVQADASTVGPI